MINKNTSVFFILRREKRAKFILLDGEVNMKRIVSCPARLQYKETSTLHIEGVRSASKSVVMVLSDEEEGREVERSCKEGWNEPERSIGTEGEHESRGKSMLVRFAGRLRYRAKRVPFILQMEEEGFALLSWVVRSTFHIPDVVLDPSVMMCYFKDVIKDTKRLKEGVLLLLLKLVTRFTTHAAITVLVTLLHSSSFAGGGETMSAASILVHGGGGATTL